MNKILFKIKRIALVEFVVILLIVECLLGYSVRIYYKFDNLIFMKYILIFIFSYSGFQYFISMKIPGESCFSPFYLVELHVGNSAKGNPFRFYRSCLKAINYAKDHNKDIIFYTWHISEEKLKSIFGDAISFYKPSLFARVVFSLACLGLFIWPRTFTKDYIQCYINISKLNLSANKKCYLQL